MFVQSRVPINISMPPESEIPEGGCRLLFTVQKENAPMYYEDMQRGNNNFVGKAFSARKFWKSTMSIARDLLNCSPLQMYSLAI